MNLSRRRNYDKKLFDLHELLNDLFALMIRTLDPSIELKLELNASCSICLGDRIQLHSSLLNILVNAKDAMPEGGEISILSEDRRESESNPDNLPPGQYIIVRIIDSGTGIPLNNVDTIFEPFYTTKSPDRGTGLGLPSALEVVKHHGGTILIETSNKGSTFSIYLPKSPDAVLEGLPSEQKFDLKMPFKRILLAEDLDFLRRLYRELLEDLGFEVETCCDGKEALERLADDQAFDVLITDIKMPRVDGFQLYEEMQEFVPNLPVIMISGFSDQARVKALSDQGSVIYLQKPFTDKELLKGLEHFLGHSRQH